MGPDNVPAPNPPVRDASPYSQAYREALLAPVKRDDAPAAGRLSGLYSPEAFVPPQSVSVDRAQGRRGGLTAEPRPNATGAWSTTSVTPTRYRHGTTDKKVSTATLLAALFGAFGLAYISVRAMLVGLGVWMAAAMITPALGLLVWVGCIGAARAGVRGHRLEDAVRVRVKDLL